MIIIQYSERICNHGIWSKKKIDDKNKFCFKANLFIFLRGDNLIYDE